jgi:c-di-GMP-binding flagellar brake protein YcgR
VSEAPSAPELTPRQRVDLRVASDDGVHSLRTHLDRVDRATGRMRVGWPNEHMRLFPLMPGQLVMVEVTRPGDGLYALETLIESASMEEPPTLILRPDGPWQRVQRRRAERYVIDMRPSYALLLRAETERPTSFSAVLADLSAGGMRLNTAIELHVGDQVELGFGTPSGGAELRLRVNVVRVARLPGHAPDAWEAGCQYVEPSATDREQIVQFILARQAAIAR